MITKIGVSLWFIGFFIFAGLVLLEKSETPLEGVDAVIVLTGSSGRIQKGFELFDALKAPYLFISGVFNHTFMPPQKNIILGRTAKDTYGNIREIKTWINQYNLKKILIVTHSYHTPRVRFLLKRMNIDAQYYALRPSYSVKSCGIFFMEYHKFLFTHMAYFLNLRRQRKILEEINV